MLNKKNSNLLPIMLTVGLLSALPLPAFANDYNIWQPPEQSDWYMSGAITGLAGSYSGSSLRDQFYSAGISISGEYLESHGVSFGYTNSTVKFKSGIDSTLQNDFYLGGHKNINSDRLPGTIDLRLNTHYITNNDSTGDSDEVKVVAPLISYLNYKKSFYADIGYAYSSYQNDLTIGQITPTIGFGFNSAADWLQFRGYFINSSNADRSQGKSNTGAIQLKYIHWFAPYNFLRLNTFSLVGLAGERINAVDLDSHSVYNLADVQKGSVAVDLSWKLNSTTALLFHAGYDRYENLIIDEKYSSTAAVLSLSKEW
jgi:hypothetical protein